MRGCQPRGDTRSARYVYLIAVASTGAAAALIGARR